MIVLSEDNEQSTATFDISTKGELQVHPGVHSTAPEEFSGRVDFVSAMLPSSVEVIDDNSFSFTSNLKKLQAYGSISYLGESAFEGSGIETIEFKQGCASVNDSAFKDCKNLKEIICRDFASLGNDQLGESVFYKCESLKEITLSNSLRTIKRATFFKCKSLETIQLPPNLETIGEYAFGGCQALKNIDIPNSVYRLDRNCFAGCTALTFVRLPLGIKIVDERAFYKCASLTAVEVPDATASLDMRAFEECPNLRYISVSQQTVVSNQELLPQITVEVRGMPMQKQLGYY